MKKLLFLFAALIAGASLTSYATSRTWTGAAGDGKYTTAENWSPVGSPVNNNYTDSVAFDGNVGTVNIDASRTINTVTIKTPGWRFIGSDLKTKGYKVSADLGEIVASGFGLTDSNNSGYSIGSGTTLLVNNGFTIQNTSTPGLTGGGTLHLKSKFSFNYYSDGGSFVVSGDSLLITDQTLADFAGTHSSYNWTIKLNSQNARFICKDSLANVQARFETTAKNAWNLSCTYDTENYQLAARELSGDWSGYVEVYLQSANVPVLASASVARNSGVYEVTAQMSQGVDGTTVKAVAYDGAGNTVETVYEGALAIDEDFLFALSGLVDGKTYAVKVVAENTFGNSEMEVSETFYTGNPELALTVDAYERDVIAGTVTVSRAEASINPLTVNYQFTGITAEEGVDYEAPSGTVVIPGGATSAGIVVQPILNMDKTEDTTLQVSLSAGMYDESADPVTVTIHDFTIPTDSCVWMGDSGVDNNASTAANWYQSKLPTKDDKILLAAFSSSNLVWDAGVNGLPDTVASWEQTVDYKGTVTFPTVYPVEGVDDAFTNFTVTGDCVINGGKWTSLANDNAEVYALNVKVGGNLTIGAGGTITVMGKGYAVGKYPSGSAIGAHAATYTGDSSHIYGDVYAPTRCGSGGFSGNYSASCGGGAIVLSVAGSAVVDGTLDAQSSTQSSAKNGNPEKGVGAGGSIFVTASSISGNGTVIASAYESNGTSYANEAGSGGRIALIATTGAVTIPNAKLKCSGSFGGNGVGGGTIFIKNASDEYGTLLVEDRKTYADYNYGCHWPTKGRFAMVKAGEIWTFDRILFSGRGILSVPQGATLVLPNGFASISCLEDNSTPHAGIIYLGGTISVPETATHELKGSWLFQAASPYVFPVGDVVLSDKAGFGCFELHSSGADPTNQPNCEVTVNGNLTIANGSSLLATGRGHRSTGSTYGGAHGGIGYTMSDDKTYDSIIHPKYAGGSAGSGNGGVENNPSGGAVKLTVVGEFVMNGIANVKSSVAKYESNKAASGSLDITAGSLSGSGSFCADGLVSDSSSALSGAGGRIAIHLTDADATFDNFDVTKITANAAMASGNPTKAGSAGTVYLESGTPGSGTVIVKSTNSAVTTPTPIPSRKWGGEDDDLSKASLSVQSYGIVALTESLKMSALTVGSNAKLDLNGKTLTVIRAKLGDTKLAVGTYAADDAALGGFVSDSAGEGSLVVKGAGLRLLLR